MRKIITSILLLIPLFLLAQNNSNNISSPENRKEKLLEAMKELFVPNVNITFNIAGQDLNSSFTDMASGKKYDTSYLNTLLEAIKKDSLNPINLNNVAEYYAKKENFDLSNKYYSKALTNIDEKFFNNDKACFYSTRGLIKTNLGDTTAIKDFKKAISINPNDSISKYFYPISLITVGKHNEVIKLTEKQFNSEVDNPYIPYLYLTLSVSFKSFQHILSREDTSYKKEYVKKNYDDIIDYSLLDKYAQKYKGNQRIQNCRLLANILGLFYKIVFFEHNEKDLKLVLSYTDYEKNKTKNIITELKKAQKRKTINQYTLNKCLGYCFFILEDHNKSIEYFSKAINCFPADKEDPYFKPLDCYDAIAMIYNQQSDTINLKKALKSKMIIDNQRQNNIDEFSLAVIDYKNNELEKAEESCTKIRATDPKNFNALRLLAHLKFIGNSGGMTEFYGGMAGQSIKSNEENYNLLMQFAIYQIYNGDFNAADSNIRIAQQIIGNENCDLCDKLLKMIPK